MKPDKDKAPLANTFSPALMLSVVSQATAISKFLVGDARLSDVGTGRNSFNIYLFASFLKEMV